MNMTGPDTTGGLRSRDMTTNQDYRNIHTNQMYTSQTMPVESRNSAGTSLPAPTSIIPTTMESDLYFTGILREYIGQRMRVQFLIGTTGPLIDITGQLLQVGANYIILQPIETDDHMICDLYSIKFVTIYK